MRCYVSSKNLIKQKKIKGTSFHVFYKTLRIAIIYTLLKEKKLHQKLIFSSNKVANGLNLFNKITSLKSY